jgi:hypothetical protein
MIDPQLSEGDLVKVAAAQNESEAELIQNLLLEAGVPSVLRRTQGFDVPDFLAAGPRDVLVPSSGVPVARAMLLDPNADAQAPEPVRAPEPPRPVKLIGIGLLIGLAIVTCFAWYATELLV